MGDYLTRRRSDGRSTESFSVLVQHGGATNGPSGYADVVFELAFAAPPRVDVTQIDGTGTPVATKVCLKTVAGFRIVFGGDETTIPSVDWSAREKEE